MVEAMESSDSIGWIVLCDKGEKLKWVTRSTSLSVADATRRSVLTDGQHYRLWKISRVHSPVPLPDTCSDIVTVGSSGAV